MHPWNWWYNHRGGLAVGRLLMLLSSVIIDCAMHRRCKKDAKKIITDSFDEMMMMHQRCKEEGNRFIILLSNRMMNPLCMKRGDRVWSARPDLINSWTESIKPSQTLYIKEESAVLWWHHRCAVLCFYERCIKDANPSSSHLWCREDAKKMHRPWKMQRRCIALGRCKEDAKVIKGDAQNLRSSVHHYNELSWVVNHVIIPLAYSFINQQYKGQKPKCTLLHEFYEIDFPNDIVIEYCYQAE